MSPNQPSRTPHKKLQLSEVGPEAVAVVAAAEAVEADEGAQIQVKQPQPHKPPGVPNTLTFHPVSGKGAACTENLVEALTSVLSQLRARGRTSSPQDLQNEDQTSSVTSILSY